MTEFFRHLSELSPRELIADTHGGLAMLALILFGASLVLIRSLGGFTAAAHWLRKVLALLWIDLIVLNLIGLLIYIPYRATGGPRSTLLSSESTAWYHQILFEHKEFLAFAPMMLILAALWITNLKGDSLSTDKQARRALAFSVVTALIFVLVVAAEAVLVTKAAPLR